MPSKTAALLVVILAAAAIRPVACGWLCAPELASHESCHESAPADGAQLSSGITCDVELVTVAGTLTKTTSIDRTQVVRVGAAIVSSDRAHNRLVTSFASGCCRRAAAPPLSVLRI